MGLGLTEMIVLLVIVLVFFGAGKLPTVMGDLAKGVRSFKQGLQGDGDESAPAAEPDRLASGRASESQHNAPPTLLPSPGKAAGENNRFS